MSLGSGADLSAISAAIAIADADSISNRKRAIDARGKSRGARGMLACAALMG